MAKTRKKLPGDVLDVELEITTTGTIQVEMTRAQLEKLREKHPGRRHFPLDDVPGVDWRGITEAVEFEATIDDVFDGNE